MDLVQPCDVAMPTEPAEFGHGKGRMLGIKCADDNVQFNLSGTLVFGLSDAFAGAENSTRRGLLVRYDQDAEANAGMSEWFAGLAERIMGHICDNVKAIFPDTPREVIEENGFTMVDTRYGGEAVKLRVDLENTQVLIRVDDGGDGDEVMTKRVPKDQVQQVLTRDAHVQMTCELSFVWLDETMTYGVSISVLTCVVEPSPPRPPRSLTDMEANLANVIVAPEPKKFPGGQGRYVGLSLEGTYPAFTLSDTIGEECDGLTAKFQPSAGKDAPPDSDRLSVPVGVPRGSTLHNVLGTLDAMFLKMGATWFPGKGPAALKAMFKSPCKEKEGYDPTLYVKLNRGSVAGREATRVWLVPGDAPPMSMADAMTTEHGYPEGTVDDINKGGCLSIAVTTSCAWLQSATYGYGMNATHVFVHPGRAAAPLEIDGRAVKMTGDASTDDIDAFLGRPAKRHCPDACDMMDSQFDIPCGEAEPRPPFEGSCGDTLEPGEIPMAQRTY
jgi:hypothetical protein